MVVSSALPRLELTDSDTMELRKLSAQLEREIVIQYEDFLYNRQRQVDTTKWKRVKSEGELHAFRERHVGNLRRDTGPQSALAAQSPLPRILLAGTIDGKLDDSLLGCSFYDTASLRALQASTKDMMQNIAVLHTIETASDQDPFRFLGIVWMLRTFGLPAALMNHRDCLQLFDIHLSHLANGERVGICIGHSIQHKRLPELDQYYTLRAESSMVQVLRQVDADRVEVFVMQYLDIKGSVPDALHLMEAIKFTLNIVVKAQSSGFNHKLRWLMRHKDKCRALSRSEASESSTSSNSSYGSGSLDHHTKANSSTCELCAQPRRRIFGRKGSMCRACHRYACSHCISAHDITKVTSSGTPTVKSLNFCIHCILDAKSLSSFLIAKDELAQRRVGGDNPRLHQFNVQS